MRRLFSVFRQAAWQSGGLPRHLERDMDPWDLLAAFVGALNLSAMVAAAYLALLVFVAMVAIFSRKRGKRAKRVLALLVRAKLPPDG